VFQLAPPNLVGTTFASSTIIGRPRGTSQRCSTDVATASPE